MTPVICDIESSDTPTLLRCTLDRGHRGPHRDDRHGESWPQ